MSWKLYVYVQQGLKCPEKILHKHVHELKLHLQNYLFHTQALHWALFQLSLNTNFPDEIERM